MLQSVFRKGLFWLIAFTAMFALSLDYWNWEATGANGWLHIPAFVYYFAALQVALACLLYLFSKYFWSQNEGDAQKHDR